MYFMGFAFEGGKNSLSLMDDSKAILRKNIVPLNNKPAVFIFVIFRFLCSFSGR